MTEFNPALDEPTFDPEVDATGYDLSGPQWGVCTFNRDNLPKEWEWIGSKEDAIKWAEDVSGRLSNGSIVTCPELRKALWVPPKDESKD